MKSALSVAAVLCLALHAPAHAQGFPADAVAPQAAELKKYLDGRVFDVKLADGTSWRLEFNARGHFFVNTSTGFNGQGNWRTEDGKLCSALRGNTEACNDARQVGDVLHMKRTNGEFIQYVPR